MYVKLFFNFCDDLVKKSPILAILPCLTSWRFVMALQIEMALNLDCVQCTEMGRLKGTRKNITI